MTARWAVDSAGVAVYPPVAAEPRRWRDYSACGTVDPEAFYPPEGTHGFELTMMKNVCRRSCPVRGECLEFALENPEDAEYGTWGGLTHDDLRRVRRAWNRARKAVAA